MEATNALPDQPYALALLGCVKMPLQAHLG
jgi:hypothetical protein